MKPTYLKSLPGFLGMLLATAACGLVVGFGVGLLLAKLWSNNSEGWGGLIGAVVGIVYFYPIGVFVGQIIFKRAHFRGSLLLGMVGIFTGVLAGIMTNALVHSPDALIGGWLIYIPLLGTAGYYLGRRKPLKQ